MCWEEKRLKNEAEALIELGSRRRREIQNKARFCSQKSVLPVVDTKKNYPFRSNLSLAVMRVVSLLPSATEIIALVLEEEQKSVGSDGQLVQLVGRSHECDFPLSVSHLPVLTGSRIMHTNSKDIDEQVKVMLLATDTSRCCLDMLIHSLNPTLLLSPMMQVRSQLASGEG
jgi:hypothetical protein